MVTVHPQNITGISVLVSYSLFQACSIITVNSYTFQSDVPQSIAFSLYNVFDNVYQFYFVWQNMYLAVASDAKPTPLFVMEH